MCLFVWFGCIPTRDSTSWSCPGDDSDVNIFWSMHTGRCPLLGNTHRYQQQSRKEAIAELFSPTAAFSARVIVPCPRGDERFLLTLHMSEAVIDHLPTDLCKTWNRVKFTSVFLHIPLFISSSIFVFSLCADTLTDLLSFGTRLQVSPLSTCCAEAVHYVTTQFFCFVLFFAMRRDQIINIVFMKSVASNQFGHRHWTRS